MKDLWNRLVSSEWALFTIMCIITAAVLIPIYHATDITPDDVEAAPMVEPEHGSYDPAIDGISSDTLYVEFALWEWNESAHALGVEPIDMTWEQFITHRRLNSVDDVVQYMRNR